MKSLLRLSWLVLFAGSMLACSSDDDSPGGASGAGGQAAAGQAGASGKGGSGGSAGASGSSQAGKGGSAGSAQAGQGGGGGASGSGGQGGSAGKGGASGSGGSGGGSGSAGSGGSAGSAGSAGSGGSAGEGGSAGSAGAQAGGSGGSGGSAGKGGAQGGSAGAGQSGASGQAGSAQAGSGGSAGGGDVAIGEWTDAPGACPEGMPRVDIKTTAQLASASRGEDAYADDAPATCYFLHNGEYASSGVFFYIGKGGVPNGARRIFVGESRSGVVIRGRASFIEKNNVSDVTIANMTFDLTGYKTTDSFNTLDLTNTSRITVDHVTFTGDCTVGHKGGHIETNHVDGVLVDSCLIEKYGSCASGGHEDHGVYLASGKNIVFRNNVIRDNSSRGVQMYTQQGKFGTLDKVTLERNRIHGNGHGDYEDGIVINAADIGTISNVTVERNLIYKNFYSGVRFVGGAQNGVVFRYNTFFGNGAGSSAASRSEVNIDEAGGAAKSEFTQNIFVAGNLIINDCFEDAALGFSIDKNFGPSKVPAGQAGNCVTKLTAADPKLADPANADFHPTNPAAQSYGAYAP